MKTLFNTVLKSTSLAIVLLASVFTLSASAATVDLGTTKLDIKRVMVKGTAKVILLQGKSEYVTIDDMDMSKVSVKQIGNTLTISSSEINPVTVYVHVKDVYHIGATDKAMVRTSGKFNMKYLQVMLKDNANARVKANTESLYTVIDDNANLELIGTTNNHIAASADVSKIKTDKFAAQKTEYTGPSEKAIALDVLGRAAISKK